MNAQAKFDKLGNLLGRGIEWTHIFGAGSGYTANPVRGCTHGCEWRMPDGSIVPCYAGSQRDRMDGAGAFKNITFHPDVFTKIKKHKERAGIFIDSMSDMLGEAVKVEWVNDVINVMHSCPHHIFFVLTKNPRRTKEFLWPDNCLLGMSAPPTFMYGKELSPSQQVAWFSKGMEWLYDAKAKHKWVSLEPLTADVCDTLEYRGALDWAVIGAGSDGGKKYQPDEGLFARTLQRLTCRVFFKGNLDRALAERHGGWREEFPNMEGSTLL